jgi:hypothetical protein
MCQGTYKNSKTLDFAADLPSRDKYDAAAQVISSLTTEELVEERACLRDAIRLEDEESEEGFGDYKVRLRIIALLEMVQERLDISQLQAFLEGIGNRLTNKAGVEALLAKWESILLAEADLAKTPRATWSAVDRIEEAAVDLKGVCRECVALAERLRSTVNGEGSTPCPDYVPTRYEVLELARHWYFELLDLETYFCYYATVGSDDWRIMAYAKRRLDRMAAALGMDAVEAVYKEVEAEFRKRMGDRDWDVCKQGSPEERTRLQDETWASTRGFDARVGTAIHWPSPDLKRYRFWFWHEHLDAADREAQSEAQAAEWFRRYYQHCDTPTLVHAIVRIDGLDSKKEGQTEKDTIPDADLLARVGELKQAHLARLREAESESAQRGDAPGDSPSPNTVQAETRRYRIHYWFGALETVLCNAPGEEEAEELALKYARGTSMAGLRCSLDHIEELGSIGERQDGQAVAESKRTGTDDRLTESEFLARIRGEG